MTPQPAPLFDDIAGGPPDGRAVWSECADGVRIRVGAWYPQVPARGTILLFPGRTEYIEKYGRAAAVMAGYGFATLAIDWRGQGLADRLLADRRVGHVGSFADYQQDVAAGLRAADTLEMPRPFHLLAHSMGGCIGLRALMQGLPVLTCAFSAPMWGIKLSPPMRAAGWAMALTAPALGLGDRIPPNNSAEPYVQDQGFDGNNLTRDAEMYEMMRHQLRCHPDLSLGGPSLQWLRAALTECRQLARQPSPAISCVSFLGSREKIVDTGAIRRRMASWPGGALDHIDGARHEVLMETPMVRDRIFDRLAAHFAAATVLPA
jgi:lysophospholipase